MELTISNKAPFSSPIPDNLKTRIEEDFSSVEALKAEFINTANAMFGPGFVWLVSTEKFNIRILVTYIAGSPYAGAHYRKQTVDMATRDASAIGAASGMAWAQQQPVSNNVGSYGPHSGKQKAVSPGGLEVLPLLCVNTWEHVWLRDYGIGGKKEYLERWWDRINWEEVMRDFPTKRLIKKAANQHGMRYGV